MIHANKTGMAGTVMILLIFGLLMSISTAYIKMVQTETEMQGMLDHSDRALDAAFSGLSYAMAVAQTKKEMFDDTTSAISQRYYFVSSYSKWSTIHTSYSDTYITNLIAKIPSDWLFLDEELALYSTANNPPYQFRVTSYPGVTGATPDPSIYLIKAQGKYIVYADDQITVDKSFTAQVIGECSIDFKRQIVRLKRYRYMRYESDDAEFFKARAY
ncbi:MAG: hypothetical protein EOM80_09790 [Erysipelotrichia bacterium]|nr:hypothetical protein [Erysipelotrichia bacterium]